MNLYYKLSLLMGAIVLASNYLVQFPIKYFGLSEILTYGAFSYPITFLITDLANRAYGNIIARRVVYIGFVVGILVAFFIAQNLDVQIFDRLRRKSWYVAPLTSSTIGSITDTFLFFSIAFYASGVPWVTLALGDLMVKLIITLAMLIPFRLLLYKIKDYTQNLGSKAKL